MCFFFKQKTAYEMRISDWSSDVCSSDLARIRDIETLVAGLEEAAGRLQTLSDELGGLLEDLQKLPSDKMSETDSAKPAAVTMSVRQMAQVFGFSTFPPEDLTIDEDSYRPQKEGYEIGFETSASDAIRLKWAYQLRSEEHTSELQS